MKNGKEPIKEVAETGSAISTLQLWLKQAIAHEGRKEAVIVLFVTKKKRNEKTEKAVVELPISINLYKDMS